MFLVIAMNGLRMAGEKATSEWKEDKSADGKTKILSSRSRISCRCLSCRKTTYGSSVACPVEQKKERYLTLCGLFESSANDLEPVAFNRIISRTKFIFYLINASSTLQLHSPAPHCSSIRTLGWVVSLYIATPTRHDNEDTGRHSLNWTSPMRLPS